MRQELIESIHSFENFVEKMDEFVYKIKSDNELNDLDMDLNHYDLRTKDGDIFPLPSDLSDFFPLFKCVVKNANTFFREEDPEKKELMANEMFFDLYWNDVEENSASFQDCCTFWVTFNDDKTLACYYQI